MSKICSDYDPPLTGAGPWFRTLGFCSPGGQSGSILTICLCEGRTDHRDSRCRCAGAGPFLVGKGVGATFGLSGRQKCWSSQVGPLILSSLTVTVKRLRNNCQAWNSVRVVRPVTLGTNVEALFGDETVAYIFTGALEPACLP